MFWKKFATILMVAFIVYALICIYSYTINGDVANVTQHMTPYQQIQEHYTCKDNVVKRLYDLHIYKTHPVSWPLTFISASLISTLILFAMDSLNWKNLFIAIPGIFIGVDVTRRFNQAHRLAGVDLEATQLYARYHEL